MLHSSLFKVCNKLWQPITCDITTHDETPIGSFRHIRHRNGKHRFPEVDKGA